MHSGTASRSVCIPLTYVAESARCDHVGDTCRAISLCRFRSRVSHTWEVSSRPSMTPTGITFAAHPVDLLADHAFFGALASGSTHEAVSVRVFPTRGRYPAGLR
jgi:hypothetical protein